jgi:hypothetical protein
MDRTVKKGDMTGGRRVQDMRRLAATIAKRMYYPARITHDQRPLESEIDAEEIARARDLRLIGNVLP